MARTPTEEEILKRNPLLLTLRPEIRPRAIVHVQLCYKNGVPVKVVQGGRSAEQQFNIFKVGRTFDAAGNVLTVDDKAKRTNIRKYSWHFLWNDRPDGALAYDLALLIDDKVVTWENADRDADGVMDWLEVGQYGEEAGLDWGGRWTRFVDMPHFERHRGLTDAEAIRRHEAFIDVVTGKALQRPSVA